MSVAFNFGVVGVCILQFPFGQRSLVMGAYIFDSVVVAADIEDSDVHLADFGNDAFARGELVNCCNGYKSCQDFCSLSVFPETKSVPAFSDLPFLYLEGFSDGVRLLEKLTSEIKSTIFVAGKPENKNNDQ